MTNYRRWTGTIAVTAGAVALAACSSTASSSPASTASSSSAASTAASAATSPTAAAASGTAASGTAITVFAITAINTPTASFPGSLAALNAAARAINAAGGINGHPVKVDSCNGMADPNQEVTCARQAAASNAVAVVGALFAANTAGALKVLQSAGMADVAGGAANPVELQSPVSFPLDGGALTPYGCLQMVKAKLASKLATIYSAIGAAQANVGILVKSAASHGVPIGASVALPPTAPDLTSQVQQLANSGANGAVMFAVPTQLTQVLTASAQLGQNTAYCTADGLVNAASLTALGPAAGNLYVAASMPPLSAVGSNPAVAHFISDMKAEQAAGDANAALTPAIYSSNTMRAWAGMQAFAQVAKTISGPVTKASFLTAIRKATNVTTGIFPPINFTKAVGGPAFPSLYNAMVQLLKWNVAKKEFVSTGISVNTTSFLG